MKIMASGPITSWQIGGETVKGSISLGSKITTDGEIKRHWLLGRKAMTNLNHIVKSRVFFADIGVSSQSYDFASSHVWL